MASAKDPFRLPKLLLCEWLALASLVPLCWRLRHPEVVVAGAVVRWRDLWRPLAPRAVLPLLAVATVGLATTRHPFHVQQALADLWIGALCLAGWSLALPRQRLEGLLRGLLWPAGLLALLGTLQFFGLQPFQFAVNATQHGARFELTATAGNPGDLAAYLVLPCLIAQAMLAGWGSGGVPDPNPGKRRSLRLALVLGVLVLSLSVLVLTQTLAALAALAAGSVVFWIGALPRRRVFETLRFAAAGALVAAVLVLAVGPLRHRAAEKAGQALHGDWNAALSGRLDGWLAALWMLEQHPWAGVGQGAYRAEFVPAKLALRDRGVAFHSGQQQNFVNAHDELLEVAADCGLPGLLALGWGLWMLAQALRAAGRGSRPAGRAPRGMPPVHPGRAAAGNGGSQPPLRGNLLPQLRRLGRPALRGGGPAVPEVVRALAWGGTAALGVLCLTDFPFRVALVAYPALLFLAWVFRRGAPEAGS